MPTKKILIVGENDVLNKLPYNNTSYAFLVDGIDQFDRDDYIELFKKDKLYGVIICYTGEIGLINVTKWFLEIQKRLVTKVAACLYCVDENLCKNAEWRTGVPNSSLPIFHSFGSDMYARSLNELIVINRDCNNHLAKYIYPLSDNYNRQAHNKLATQLLQTLEGSVINKIENTNTETPVKTIHEQLNELCDDDLDITKIRLQGVKPIITAVNRSIKEKPELFKHCISLSSSDEVFNLIRTYYTTKGFEVVQFGNDIKFTW